MIGSIPQDLSIAFAPHLRKALSTQRIMLEVVLGLIPAVVAAGVYFRLHGLLLVGVSVASCLAAESTCNLIRKRPNSLWDLSAVVTGVILALSLPPALPLWTAVIGAVFAIAIGKMVFGGLGPISSTRQWWAGHS